MKIYKLLLPREMRDLQADGTSLGAPVDLADGFVHFSTAEQLQETARRHFGGVSHMWVLCVEEAAAGPGLKWEASRGGDLFPHLYGPLVAADVLWQQEVSRNPGDAWTFAADWLVREPA